MLLRDPAKFLDFLSHLYNNSIIKVSESDSIESKKDDKELKEEEEKEKADPAVEDKDDEEENPDVAKEPPKSRKKNVGEKDKCQDKKTGGEGDSEGTRNEEDKDKVRGCKLGIHLKSH